MLRPCRFRNALQRHRAARTEAKARRKAADAKLDGPAWPGAKHSARTELAWLSASGERVGPGHPWWEAAHGRRR
jgi:hypothetical protein